MLMNITNWILGFFAAFHVAIATYILSSCTASQSFMDSKGHTTIVTTDTTHVQHGGIVSIKIK